MTSEMISRVADALKSAFKERVSAHAGEPFDGLGVAVPNDEIWVAYARAAIEAMREPTETMLAAGKDADWVGECESRAGLSIVPDWTFDFSSDDDTAKIERPGIWRAMIDAALKDV